MNPDPTQPEFRAANRTRICEEFGDTVDRKQMLEMLSESVPPAADAPAPPLPDDLRRRLEEHYGSPQPVVVRKTNVFTAFIAWWQEFAAQQRLMLGGLAAAAALVVGFLFFQRPSEPGAEIMRGQDGPTVASGPLILWLKNPASNEIQLTMEAKVPGLTGIANLAEAEAISKQRKDAVILIDTAAGAVIVMKNGAESLREPIRAPLPPDGELDAILRALRAAERAIKP